MNGPASSNKILHADPEHGGVRLGVLITIVFGLLGGYFLIHVLLNWFAQDSLLLEFATVISCSGAVPLALLCALIVEEYLRMTWSSGLYFVLSDDALSFEVGVKEDGSEDKRDFDFKQRIILTNWYLQLSG